MRQLETVRLLDKFNSLRQKQGMLIGELSLSCLTSLFRSFSASTLKVASAALFNAANGSGTTALWTKTDSILFPRNHGHCSTCRPDLYDEHR